MATKKPDVITVVDGRLVLDVALEAGKPPFAYQWAVWDWKRARVDHKPPLDHSFLWQGGSTEHQLPLFSSLA